MDRSVIINHIKGRTQCITFYLMIIYTLSGRTNATDFYSTFHGSLHLVEIWSDKYSNILSPSGRAMATNLTKMLECALDVANYTSTVDIVKFRREGQVMLMEFNMDTSKPVTLSEIKLVFRSLQNSYFNSVHLNENRVSQTSSDETSFPTSVSTASGKADLSSVLSTVNLSHSTVTDILTASLLELSTSSWHSSIHFTNSDTAISSVQSDTVLETSEPVRLSQEQSVSPSSQPITPSISTQSISSTIVTYPFQISTHPSVAFTLTTTSSDTLVLSTKTSTKSFSVALSVSYTVSAATVETSNMKEESAIRTQSSRSLTDVTTQTRHFSSRTIFMTSSGTTLLSSSVSVYATNTGTRDSLQNSVTADNIAADRIGVTISWIVLGVSVGLIPTCIICMVTYRKSRKEGENNTSSITHEHNFAHENDVCLNDETEAIEQNSELENSAVTDNERNKSETSGVFITASSADNGNNAFEMTNISEHFRHTEIDCDETSTTRFTVDGSDKILLSRGANLECSSKTENDGKGNDIIYSDVKHVSSTVEVQVACENTNKENASLAVDSFGGQEVNVKQLGRSEDNGNGDIEGNLEMQTSYLDPADEGNASHNDVTFV